MTGRSEPPEPPWGIVILNWNGVDDTLACVRSVDAAAARCREKDYVRVVVDNGSDASALAELRSELAQLPHWELIPLHSNVGFSRGMNAGITALMQQDAEYVLLLNSDVQLRDDALRALVHAQETGGPEVLGLAVAEGHGTSKRLVAGHRYYSWIGAAMPVYLSHTLGESPPEAQSESQHESTPRFDYVGGSAMLCRADFLKRIGGIPEASFLYFEELRLMQALAPGTTPTCCSAAAVVHATGTSARKLLRPSRHYYAAHACFRFTGEQGVIRLPTVVLARLLRLSYLSLKAASLTPLADGLRAFADFVRGVERQPSSSTVRRQ